MTEQTNRDTGKPVEPQSNNWTARHKKYATYTIEKDGKKTSVPVVEHLRKVGQDLPPMQDANGRRIFHFENLRRRFMAGKTKEESMSLINDYCTEIAEIWNKAVEKNKEKALQEQGLRPK